MNAEYGLWWAVAVGGAIGIALAFWRDRSLAARRATLLNGAVYTVEPLDGPGLAGVLSLLFCNLVLIAGVIAFQTPLAALVWIGANVMFFLLAFIGHRPRHVIRRVAPEAGANPAEKE